VHEKVTRNLASCEHFGVVDEEASRVLKASTHTKPEEIDRLSKYFS